MDKYVNKYGLINPRAEDIVSENCLLTTMIYINLIRVYSPMMKDQQEGLKLLFEGVKLSTKCDAYITASTTPKKGLYNQFPKGHEILVEKDKYMSPDQLIAIVCLFASTGQKSKIKEIWTYLWVHFFTYDNISMDTNFKRLMQYPAVIWVMNRRFRSKFIYNMLLASVTRSITRDLGKEERSSGAMKSFAILSTKGLCNHMDVTEIASLILILKNEFRKYYPEDHPINNMVNNIINLIK